MRGGGGLLLNGQELNLISEPSDEVIEAMISAAEAASPYKNLASSVISNIKQQIWLLHHPTSTPEVEEPETPETPSTGGEEGGEDSGDEGETADIPTTINYTLVRKNTNTTTFTVDSTEKTVKLTNSIDGKDYYYTFCAVDSASHSVTLTYLDNGRLLIEGDYIKVVATEGQDDDIILVGNHCSIYTNSGDDTVRVGIAVDSVNDYNTFSRYNYINTGSGNDYVQLKGNWNEAVGGSGEDVLLVASAKLAELSSHGITIGGFEYIRSISEVTMDSLDGVISGASQGSYYGDCKFLSVLNSIADNFSDYVEIVQIGTSYKVTFLKSGETETVTAADLAETSGSSLKSSTGDIDMVLAEIAFKKLIEADGYTMDGNATGSNTLGSSRNNFLISKYLFGVSCGTSGTCYTLTDAVARELLEALNNGNISNFIVGTNDGDSDGNPTDPSRPNNPSLGIYCNHAYAVKGGVAGSYVILCNPWDNNDTITLDWDDFLLYFDNVNLFGDTYEYVVESRSSSSSAGVADDVLLLEEVEAYEYNIFSDDEEYKKLLVSE